MGAVARVRLLVPVLFVALAVTLGPATPAHAVCECTTPAVATALNDSTVVFTGELQTVEAATPLVIMGFEVDGVYKGDIPTAFRVATFSNIDECGLGTAPPLGRWVVFATQFPADGGPFYTSACTPTALITADQALAPELGAARPPIDSAPVATTSPPTTQVLAPAVPTETDWKRPVMVAAGLMIALGLVARLLAGRRRLVT